MVADTGHGAALRHDVAEAVEQTEHFRLVHRLRIVALHTRDLRGKTPVHVGWALLIDIAIRILQGIFTNPHTGGELIATEIFKRRLVSVIIRICCLFHRY